MQPYVIRQGDYLAKLAHRYGFEADAVWPDPANAKLRDARPNPNILSPGDVLWIPDPEPPVRHPVTLGTTNTFTVRAPPTSITVRFLDQSLASQPVTIQELPHLTGLTTDANGSVGTALEGMDVESIRDALRAFNAARAAGPSSLDNAGLADNGTLDSSTAQALVRARGS